MMRYASVSALEISSLRTFELTLFDRPDRRFHFILTLFNKKDFLIFIILYFHYQSFQSKSEEKM